MSSDNLFDKVKNTFDVGTVLLISVLELVKMSIEDPHML